MAIDELGFVPKAEATAPSQASPPPNWGIGSIFHLFVVCATAGGIAAALLDAGHELVVYNAETPEHVHGYLLSLPVTRRLDGLIIISLRVDEEDCRRLIAHSLPAVLIETHSDFLSCVDIDNRAGGVLAAEHLLGQGHQRIGFVGGDGGIEGYTWRTSPIAAGGLSAAFAAGRVGAAAGRHSAGHSQPGRRSPPDAATVGSARLHPAPFLPPATRWR